MTEVDGNVLLSSPGMHEMAERIMPLLQQRSARFSHIKVGFTTFANGEIKPQIPETVRGMHAFFLHPLQHPDPNTALLSMLLTNDALMRASVAEISLVLPYIPYMRQDRKDRNDDGRTPISARTVANLIESNKKVARIITLDLHADQEEGFFDISVDNLSGSVVHAEFLRKKFHNDFRTVVVATPDLGGAVRARRLAMKLDPDVPVASIDKRRTGPNKAEVISCTGDVIGNDIVVIDDMIDTGGTIRIATAEYMKRGAKSVCICATHALFSNNAEKSFSESGYPVIVTQTIPRQDSYWKRNESWLQAVSIDALLADAIQRASTVGASMRDLSK